MSLPGKANAYEIARPGGTCAISGQVIPPGEKYMAALWETPQGMERADVSLDCWGQFDKTDTLAYWQTTMPSPQEKKKPFVDDEVLCNLFERLADAVEPLKIHFRFVLGLILIRKRLLNYESSRHGQAGDVWTVRFKGRTETLDLVDPKLDEPQMQEVSRQLGQILNEEL